MMTLDRCAGTLRVATFAVATTFGTLGCELPDASCWPHRCGDGPGQGTQHDAATPEPCGDASHAEVPPWFLPGTPERPASYTVVGDLIVDDVTGLEWPRSSDFAVYTHADAIAFCDAFVAGGHADFRLPTRLELDTIAPTKLNPLPPFDPPPPAGPYFGPTWSASRYEHGGPDEHYEVDINTGRTGHAASTESLQARCVRGKPAPAPDRFVAEGGESVRDPATGLTWQKNPFSIAFPAYGTTANELCAASTVDGGGWRAPERIELESIVDESTGFAPPFPPPDPSCGVYVSVSRTIYPPDFQPNWYVDANGNTDYQWGPTTCVRCVR